MNDYLFYANQLIFVLITFFSAKEEIYGTWAFREYAPANTIQSKLYHRWGIKTIATIGIVSAFAFNTGFLSFALLSFINAFIYWLLFDIWYAKGIGQKWYYLGNEATTDKRLKKYFGKNAGKNKAYFCIAIIVVLNIAYVLFSK